MQSVDADRVVAAAAAGSDTAWGAIVEQNVDRLWWLAIASGLAEPDAAEVCQLAWLRLSQRLSEVASAEQVTRWLEHTVRREATALSARRAERRAPAGRPDNVITLAPVDGPERVGHRVVAARRPATAEAFTSNAGYAEAPGHAPC
jgi:DNA-directed RNA polymerase specialized sigma24 family protein